MPPPQQRVLRGMPGFQRHIRQRAGSVLFALAAKSAAITNTLRIIQQIRRGERCFKRGQIRVDQG